MYISIIVAAILALLTISIPNVYASGPSVSDFTIENQEEMCIYFGDSDEMKDLCDWVNPCDDTGDVNNTAKFCTGEAVRDMPSELGGGCPEGFHVREDDETGMCYDNKLGCEWEGLVFTNDKKGCVEDDTCEYGSSFGKLCESKQTFCSTMDLNREYVREYCFSNENACMAQLNGSACNINFGPKEYCLKNDWNRYFCNESKPKTNTN